MSDEDFAGIVQGLLEAKDWYDGGVVARVRLPDGTARDMTREEWDAWMGEHDQA